MPDNDQYIGGVATVINNYFLDEDMFTARGYDISLFDYKDSHCSKIRIGSIKKIVYGVRNEKYGYTKNIKNIEILENISQKECKKIVQTFFENKR